LLGKKGYVVVVVVILGIVIARYSGTISL